MIPTRTLAAMMLFGCCLAAHADEISICYNYGCASQATVSFTASQLSRIGALFKPVTNAAAERFAIADAIGLLETFAGEQTPTFRDKGGNTADEGVDGRMDCIDHSRNTTAYLRLFEQRGWLKHHKVAGPAKRAPMLVNEHWAASVTEMQTMQQFIVDSWFYDNGKPAAIFALEDWLNGATPDE
ncbi:MAG: hypothetical protein AB1710_10225 [Pseudomonadota bacterium]